MAFQDFGILSQRRKAEREQKFKRRITIAAITIIFLLLLLGAASFFLIRTRSTQSHPSKSQSTKNATRSIDPIEIICSRTDYRDTCNNTLSKVSVSGKNQTQLNDYALVALSTASAAIDNSSAIASTLNFEKTEEKAAFEDCKILLQDARDELNSSISHINTTDRSAIEKSELNNWLSAVMSYQQTCINGFPDGNVQSQMNSTLKSVKELTSNVLAIVAEMPSLNTPMTVPDWIEKDDRRMLMTASEGLPIPNVVVAKDGSGNFTTISDALLNMPTEYHGRYVIYIKEGIYEEIVVVTKNMVNITMYGDGSQKTIVTGNKNYVDGFPTFQTATFVAIGEGFMARAMGFRNTAGAEKHEAVAIRVQSDRSVFLNCRMEGYQGTLYVQTHRQFYRSCVIAGTVDFIFGDAAAVFQNCRIVVRKPLDGQQNTITAQGRIDGREATGIVLHNCCIVADKKLEPVKLQVRSYLGRPWGEYSRMVVLESTIDDVIHPDGWLPWKGELGLDTGFYGEHSNKGAGAVLGGRVRWRGYKNLRDSKEAVNYTVGHFLQGDWIKASGAPVHFGLYGL